VVTSAVVCLINVLKRFGIIYTALELLEYLKLKTEKNFYGSYNRIFYPGYFKTWVF